MKVDLLRTCLTAYGLNRIIRKPFDEVVDCRREGSVQFSLSDTLVIADAPGSG